MKQKFKITKIDKISGTPTEIERAVTITEKEFREIAKKIELRNMKLFFKGDLIDHELGGIVEEIIKELWH